MNAAPASIPPATPRIAAALRRIGLLPPRRRLLRGLPRRLRRGGLLRRSRSLPRRTRRLRRDRAKGALEVVENEADRRVRERGGGDPNLPLRDDEHAPLMRGRLELDQRPAVTALELLCLLEEALRSLRERVGAGLVQGRRRDLARVVEHDRSLDLRRDLGQVG